MKYITTYLQKSRKKLKIKIIKLGANLNYLKNSNEKMIFFAAAARVAKDFSRGPCARTCRTRVAKRNPASLTNGREIDVSIADTRNAWRWE